MTTTSFATRWAGLAQLGLLLLFIGSVCAQSRRVLTLSGSGTTNPSKLLWRVFSDVEEMAGFPVRATYRAVGSGTGIAEFAGDSSNGFQPFTMFGSADIPLPADVYQGLVGSGQTVYQIPFVLGTVSVFAKLKDGSGPLKLSPCLLARIFSRKILYWDDPDIKAENPSLEVDPGTAITVVHRTDGSSSTAGFTEYLNKACPSEWGDKVGKTINWPDQTVGAAGSSGVAGELLSTEFGIGYLSSGHGLGAGLPEVQLQNEDGVYLTSSALGANEALNRASNVPTDYTQDMNSVDLINLSGPDTWPITQLSYLFIRQDQSGAGETGSFLKAVAEMLFSEEVQNERAAEYGLVGLPQSTIANARNNINGIIIGNGVEEWVVESGDERLPGPLVLSPKRQSWTSSQLRSLTSEVSEVSGAVQEHISMQIHGSGTTNPSTLFWQTMQMLQDSASRPLSISYRAVGSSTGQFEFIGKDNGYTPYTHFGSGDLPLSNEQYSELTDGGHPVVQLPFLIGAIGVFHSVPADIVGDEGIKLDSCLLARIFQANITSWDHPDILDQNPQLKGKIPGGTVITVYHRDLGSSSTAGVTQYLERTCPEDWVLGSGALLDTWPTSTVAVQGSSNMVASLRDNAYAIGYADAGYGWNANLEEVWLKNRDGNYLTSKEADVPEAARVAVAEGQIPTSCLSDFSEVSLLDQPGERTFPITTVSYIYLRQDLRYIGSSVGVLVAMLEFLLSEDAHPYFAEHSFFPPPDEVADLSRRGVAELLLPSDAPSWQFETSTRTRPGVGSSPYVFSGKRKTYATVKAAQVESQLTSLDTMCAGISDEVAELRSQNEVLKALSIAAICISGVAFLGMAELLCIVLRGKATCCGRGKEAGGGGGPGCLPSPQYNELENQSVAASADNVALEMEPTRSGIPNGTK